MSEWVYVNVPQPEEGCPTIPPGVKILGVDTNHLARTTWLLLGFNGQTRYAWLREYDIHLQAIDHLEHAHGVTYSEASEYLRGHAHTRAAVALLMD